MPHSIHVMPLAPAEKLALPSRPLPHSHRIAPSLPYTNLQPSPANTCAVVSDRSPRANRSVHPEPVPLPPALQPRIVRYRLAASPAPAASHSRLFPLQPPLCVCPASIPPASHACPTASAATSRAIARPFSRRQSPNPSAVRQHCIQACKLHHSTGTPTLYHANPSLHVPVKAAAWPTAGGSVPPGSGDAVSAALTPLPHPPAAGRALDGALPFLHPSLQHWMILLALQLVAIRPGVISGAISRPQRPLGSAKGAQARHGLVCELPFDAPPLCPN